MPHQPDPDDMMLVDDILVGWRSKRRNTPATPAARDNARRTVTAFAHWLAAERGVTLWDARPADCQAWLDARLGEVKARTVAKNWSELRAFYSTAAVDRAKPLGGRRSPMATILMPAYGKHPETHVASPAEVERLVDTFDLRTGLGLRNATMVWLMFGSGLRCGETARVQLDHVDLERRSVFLPVTKTMEERTAPLHPDAVTFLTRYIKRRGEEPGPLLISDGPRLAACGSPSRRSRTWSSGPSPRPGRRACRRTRCAAGSPSNG